MVLSALKHQVECGAPQLQCTFNGTWGGPRVPKVFYISSYFWDRATDAGRHRWLGGSRDGGGSGDSGARMLCLLRMSAYIHVWVV